MLTGSHKQEELGIPIPKSRLESDKHNRTCYPGGLYWDYCPDALSCSQVTATHLMIGAAIGFIYSYPIFKWVKETWLHDKIASLIAPPMEAQGHSPLPSISVIIVTTHRWQQIASWIVYMKYCPVRTGPLKGWGYVRPAKENSAIQYFRCHLEMFKYSTTCMVELSLNCVISQDRWCFKQKPYRKNENDFVKTVPGEQWNCSVLWWPWSHKIGSATT